MLVFLSSAVSYHMTQIFCSRISRLDIWFDKKETLQVSSACMSCLLWKLVDTQTCQKCWMKCNETFRASVESASCCQRFIKFYRKVLPLVVYVHRNRWNWLLIQLECNVKIIPTDLETNEINRHWYYPLINTVRQLSYNYKLIIQMSHIFHKGLSTRH